MRGRVTEWKDDRGFGFIESEAAGERVFFHISGVVRGAPRPSTGTTVSFDLGHSADRFGFGFIIAVAASGRLRRRLYTL